MDKTKSKEIKFIAVYARVSTSNQEDQKTVEAQLSAVYDFAKKNGYEIAKKYVDEGWSGDIIARPQLDQLRQDARKKMFQAVLIYDPDRLGRKLIYQLIVIDELKQLEIETIFVTRPQIKNDNDELMFSILGSFAQYEKGKITERFRIGKINRVKNNQILTSVSLYGFDYVPNKGKRGNADYVAGHYEVNERERKILNDIFLWVDKGLTLRGVVRKLQELGIPPQKSKRGVWSTSTLSVLLRNETLIGKAHWGASYATVPLIPHNKAGYRKITKSSRKMKPKEEWYEITIPPIIDEDLFRRVGLKLKTNFALMGRNKKNHYLLAGIIFCTCGQRRAGEGPQNGKYLYYRCTDRVHSFPLPHTCKEIGVNARIADKAIWLRIEEIFKSPELMLAQVERFQKESENKTESCSTIDIERTKEEIKKLQAQEDNLARAYSQEVISLIKFEEYVKPLREKIRIFEDQILQANLEKVSKSVILLPSKDQIETFAQEAVKYVKDLSFSAKQMIIRQTVNKVIASRESLQVYGYINLNLLYVVFCSEYRNRWITKRRQVHII